MRTLLLLSLLALAVMPARFARAEDDGGTTITAPDPQPDPGPTEPAPEPEPPSN